MKHDVSRREILAYTSGTVILGSTIPTAAADDERGPPEDRGRGDLVEVNVGYRGERGRDVAADAAADVRRNFSFDAMTIRVPEQAIQGLENNPNVRYVEENETVEVKPLATAAQTANSVSVSDDGREVPWGIDRIGALGARERGLTGDGTNIAVLDTGIDPNHPDIESNLGEGVAFIECTDGEELWDWFPDDFECAIEWDDDFLWSTLGHGTPVAAITSASLNAGITSIAPESTVHPVKMASLAYTEEDPGDEGHVGLSSLSIIAESIDWTKQTGQEVANMSFGFFTESELVHDAVKSAAESGVLLVAGAGNENVDEDSFQYDGEAPVGYPAAYDEVIAVSATNEDDEFAWFSSFGPEVDITAPGEDLLLAEITYTDEEYSKNSGTSFASPHVAGAGALLMANGLTADEARQRLLDTAEDIGLPPKNGVPGCSTCGLLSTTCSHRSRRRACSTPSTTPGRCSPAGGA